MLLIRVSRCPHLRHNLLRLSRPSFNSTRWISSKDGKEYEVGENIHGYKLERVEFIKELNIRPYYLRHIETGAEHLHIRKDDDTNNVFSISLRTTPKNSTGVAHILEHLALCGSKKYKVRDPFMKMLTRSLATFMNAMTGPDFTAYPFSTQNRKDFENLLSVYTDAVFFPRLKAVDFRQEGWRLEHEKPDKKETPIVLRGVVYNEMKGAFSSSSAIYGRRLLNNLFPDSTYRYDSGGDPENIPELTRDELKKFHQNHYHPSNAKFFTYGDIPLEHHLKLLNDMVMSKFSENSQAREQSKVTEQEPWKKPRKVDITCPEDPMSASPDKQTTTSLSYMLPTLNTNLEEMLALQLLSSLLIDGPNAPFHKSLIESGLGSDYSPSTGLGNYTKQPYFSIGLQGIHRDDIAKVHDTIERTFKEVAATGFSQDRIDAVLHNIELGLKHISGNFGLRLLMSLECTWNHDGDVVDFFKVNKYVDKFKDSIASDKYFWKNLISRHFLANNHRLVLNMSPDKDFEEKRKDRERTMLEDKVSRLNDVDKQTVLYEGMELMKMQNMKDDPSILPCLEPSVDISRDLNYKTPLQFDHHKGVNIQFCPQPTNEVVYFKALTDIGSKLHDSALIDYLPLFCDVATKLGAGSYDRHALSQQAQLTTGGLSVSLLINPSLIEFDQFKSEILLGSHCLRRNVDSMFDLWTNVFKQIHYKENKDYLLQLIKASAADLADGVSHSSHLYAMKRSARLLSEVSSLDEKLSGLTFVARMKDMASKESVDHIASRLENISRIILDPFSLKCAINAEPDAMQSTSESLKKFLDTTQKYDASQENPINNVPAPDLERTSVEDLKFPFATHSVVKSLVTVPRSHEDFPKLVILCKLISSKYLLREVREKGGAYGAGARVSNSGILNFFSYRDPNNESTMKVYDYSCRWLEEGKEFSERDIEESKLGVFQEVDKPVEPGRRGLNFFIHGESDDMRQEYRRRLLEVSKEDIIDVAKKYLNQEKFGSYIL